MTIVKDVSRSSTLESPSSFLDILSQGSAGAWVLRLPPSLRTYENELESLLGRVFSGRQSAENLELAQQMTLNWCVSKCRKMGVSLEEISK
jgi:hypothetical protein